MKREGRDIGGDNKNKPNNKASIRLFFSAWVYSKSQFLETDPVGGINGRLFGVEVR